MNPIEQILRNHLPKNITVERKDRLFSTGILDSLSLIDIVQEVESHFQIRVHWSELNLDNFDSIERIEHYVHTKTK